MSYLENYAPRFEILVNGEDNPKPELQDSVISLEVSEEIGASATFSITLSDNFDIDKEKFTWLDNPMVQPGEKIKIKMGYAEKLVDMIEGEIKTMTASGFSQSSVPTLSLVGYDPAHTWLAKSPGTTKKEKSFKKKGTEIIQMIIDETDINKGKVDSPSEGFATQVKQGSNTTYGTILQDQANKIGYEFFTSRNKIYYINPRKDPIAITSFEWGKNLIQFTPQMNTADLVPEVKVRSSSPTSRAHIPGEGNTGKEDVLESVGTITASAYIKKKFPNKKPKEITDRKFSSESEAKTWALSELNRISDKFVTGDGSVVGTPELQVGQVLELKRLGLKFSGMYFTTKVTHSISTNGFTTNFSVRKNVIKET